MEAGHENKPADKNAVEMLKHDIKNQLSNIQLALEGLKYEAEDIDGDFGLYLDSITQSTAKIDKLLNNFE
jgi:nitrogen fixation/metabolism regulation signal transduction histidine kinase